MSTLFNINGATTSAQFHEMLDTYIDKEAGGDNIIIVRIAHDNNLATIVDNIQNAHVPTETNHATHLLKLYGCDIEFSLNVGTVYPTKMTTKCADKNEYNIDLTHVNYATDAQWFNELAFIIAEQLRFGSIIYKMYGDESILDYISHAAAASQYSEVAITGNNTQGLQCNGASKSLYNNWGKLSKICLVDNIVYGAMGKNNRPMNKVIYSNVNQEEKSFNVTEPLIQLKNWFESCTSSLHEDSVVTCEDIYNPNGFEEIAEVGALILV